MRNKYRLAVYYFDADDGIKTKETITIYRLVSSKQSLHRCCGLSILNHHYPIICVIITLIRQAVLHVVHSSEDSVVAKAIFIVGK
jgi:hypothetical protein